MISGGCQRAYFNPLPSCEGRLSPKTMLRPKCLFQSTPLMRGETFSLTCYICVKRISIHSPHARGDVNRWITFTASAISIHSPHARGDLPPSAVRALQRHFNPLPSCEGRLYWHTYHCSNIYISIHSPHARGDICGICKRQSRSHFNPLPSCEGRPLDDLANIGKRLFQSTPLMRGETGQAGVARWANFISIHSPHARGDQKRIIAARRGGISIHSPHARGDTDRQA